MISTAPSRPAPVSIGPAEAWRQAHQTVTREYVTRLGLVEGAIPTALRGILYRNGPARFERGSTTYGHLFDGDGMVASFGFDDLGVLYRNRYVRTEAFDEEERTGRLCYRGFGTPLPGGMARNLLRPRFKNTANTSVVVHAGMLLALWEGGLPHRLDPLSLATIGPYDFDGALRASPSIASALTGRELPFCAHPKRDPATGELFAFGLRMGMRSSLLLHRVEPGGTMKPTRAVPLDALWFVHDFAVTPRWLVFVLSPVAFGVASMLLGRKTPAESLVGDPARSVRVLAVERSSLDDRTPRVFVASSEHARGFSFHVVNAFETGDRRLSIDVAWMDAYPDLPSPGASLPLLHPRLTRLDADLASGRLDLAPTNTLLEIPEIDPRAAGTPHRVAWGLGGRSRLSGIVRWEKGGRSQLRDFAPDVIAPPLFVPRPGAAVEGDGWLLTTAYDCHPHESELLVLDAATLRTIARARLPHVLPPHFHGCWVPSAG